ncbi:hypothetical protein ISN44_As10g006430 [Arabidopsis suecica]|uniref:Uncharacterized protein n=1 Tax=Arabidopsis suecica TaxID=45249 RepID=A0A8T1ZV64_ARASU|nr:hypothetical protein ISN44_As10g006430 [Arabidopsis suecica]KAG7563885.1 hypothetical protein ISN44_As10g006430 [Arabidopsis suecica]
MFFRPSLSSLFHIFQRELVSVPYSAVRNSPARPSSWFQLASVRHPSASHAEMVGSCPAKSLTHVVLAGLIFSSAVNRFYTDFLYSFSVSPLIITLDLCLMATIQRFLAQRWSSPTSSLSFVFL